MEQDPHLLVYRASAGSGKTFTLAVEYIRQLIEDPFAYRRILAVTFTNKATAEMKERILSQLYGIAHKDPDSDGYLNKIREHSSKSDAEIREAAAQALKNIIHDYSRFRIETIDSFFQSVMRNLARELELGANLNIELNNGEVLSDAVDSMIEKLDRRSPVLHWLLEYIGRNQVVRKKHLQRGISGERTESTRETRRYFIHCRISQTPESAETGNGGNHAGIQPTF